MRFIRLNSVFRIEPFSRDGKNCFHACDMKKYGIFITSPLTNLFFHI